MYFVDREKMEATLHYIERNIAFFENQATWDSIIELNALERICHVLIDCILDVGNAMIDGFIMRDPGSYEDIINILEDEKVLSKKHADGIKLFVQYRKGIVQDYMYINHEELLSQLKDSLEDIKAFAPQVRSYLEKELGSVTTFKN